MLYYLIFTHTSSLIYLSTFMNHAFSWMPQRHLAFVASWTAERLGERALEVETAVMAIIDMVADTVMAISIAILDAITGKSATTPGKNMGTDTILVISMTIQAIIEDTSIVIEVVINTIITAISVDSTGATMMGTRAMIKILNTLTSIATKTMKTL